eukprot:gene13444-18026_t
MVFLLTLLQHRLLGIIKPGDWLEYSSSSHSFSTTTPSKFKRPSNGTSSPHDLVLSEVFKIVMFEINKAPFLIVNSTEESMKINLHKFSKYYQFQSVIELHIIERFVEESSTHHVYFKIRSVSAAIFPAFIPFVFILSLPFFFVPFPDFGANESYVNELIGYNFAGLEENGLISGMKSSPEQKTATYNALKYPLIAYGAISILYLHYIQGSKFTWFSWHPIAMIISFIVLASNAALIKKIGGYENTKLHGNIMFAATAIAGFGWYVIYSNKEKFKRPHLTTIHGKLSIIVLVGYLSIGIVGAVALNPDFGLYKSNKQIRLAHKLLGRIMTAAAWVSCVLGFMTLEKEIWKQVLFGAPMVVGGLYILL